MQKNGFIKVLENNIQLLVEIDKEFTEYVLDLLEYGLTRYLIDNGDETSFKLGSSYRMDQVQLKLLKDHRHNQRGTYIYNKEVYIFASIKKDASIQEHLNYKDKFLSEHLFQ